MTRYSSIVHTSAHRCGTSGRKAAAYDMKRHSGNEASVAERHMLSLRRRHDAPLCVILSHRTVVEGVLSRGDAAHEQRQEAPKRRPFCGGVNAQRASVHLQHVTGSVPRRQACKQEQRYCMPCKCKAQSRDLVKHHFSGRLARTAVCMFLTV